MTNHDPVGPDRARELMMAAIDGEIAAEERRELDELLARSPDLAVEWRRLTRVKEITMGMTLQNVPDEVWDDYWSSVYRRTERGIGWMLISAGAVVLAAYWLWHAIGELIDDTGLPPAIRIAIVAVAVGLVVLMVSVVREKLFMHRRDPYKEITR